MPNPRQILEHINQGIITTDMNGIVTYWNSACEQIFGYSSEEMINKPLSKIYPFVAKEQYHQNIQKLKSGEEVKGQWKSITKGGEIIWIDVHARPLMDDDNKQGAIIASAHDIGELKKVEKELEENKAWAQAILEATVCGIITINREGYILDFNHSATRIFGYSEEELLGENVNLLIPGPHHGSHDNYINRFLEPDEEHIIGSRRELLGCRKDGSAFPLEVSVGPIDWEGEQFFIAVINDISERRRLEREILRISEEERQSLGQDLHDGLGQMLTGIHLISKNLARKLKSNGTPGSDEIQEIADMIKEADEYAKALAHGMVQVDFEKEGLGAALKQLSRQVEKLFGVNCTVSNEDSVSIPNYNYGMHLYRIAQESISNAVKHGKAKNITIDLKTENDLLKLSVKDDGVGFEESHKNKEKRGLGIPIMRYRASILSGRIEIFETEDKTNVVCTIPNNSKQ